MKFLGIRSRELILKLLLTIEMGQPDGIVNGVRRRKERFAAIIEPKW